MDEKTHAVSVGLKLAQFNKPPLTLQELLISVVTFKPLVQPLVQPWLGFGQKLFTG